MQIRFGSTRTTLSVRSRAQRAVSALLHELYNPLHEGLSDGQRGGGSPFDTVTRPTCWLENDSAHGLMDRLDRLDSSQTNEEK